MLNRLNHLIGMSITATDGDIGKVKDVYFDDHLWAARYLVVETGGWLDNKRVLISPFSVRHIDWDLRSISVNLTRERIKGSPPVDTDRPVSRQSEIDFSGYYGYPGYWSGPMLWGSAMYPMMPVDDRPLANEALPGHTAPPTDPHLRSAKEVSGYSLQARDAAIGHLEDFLVEDASWAIRYLVVDTRNWWPGKHVVIPPQWINKLDWAEQNVQVDVLRDSVQHAPEYDPGLEFSRAEESSLYRHYERINYWD